MGADTFSHYPAFLDLRGALAVIVGGGVPALKKARSLVRYGADIVVIGTALPMELRELEAEGTLSVEEREYVRGDLAGARLALCLQSDEETARAVAAEAREVGALVNVAGRPELSTFVVPSSVDRSPLQIAITTSGEAPELAKSLRSEFAARFGPEWSELVALIGTVRPLIAKSAADTATYRAAVDALDLDGLRDRIAAGESPDPDTVASQALAAIEGGSEADDDSTGVANDPAEGEESARD